MHNHPLQQLVWLAGHKLQSFQLLSHSTVYQTPHLCFYMFYTKDEGQVILLVVIEILL